MPDPSRRIIFRRGEGCVYTRCPYCGKFISEEIKDGDTTAAKDCVGEALAAHANENHLPEGEEGGE